MNVAKYVQQHADKVYQVHDYTGYEIVGSNVLVPETIPNSSDIVEEVNDIEFKKEHLYDYKVSFDNVNFENEEQAKELLSEIAEQLCNTKVDSSFEFKERERKIPVNNTKLIKKFESQSGLNIKSKERVVEKHYGKEQEVFKYIFDKKYEREGNLNNAIIAVHTKSYEEHKGQDHYKVKPHIHIVIHDKRKAHFGQKFKLLNDIISRESAKRNLVSSIDNSIKNRLSDKEYKEFIVLKSRITAFSWSLAKHDKKEYFYKEQSEYKSKHSDKIVNLSNIQSKVDRYLKLGGSVAFVKKIQYNMDNKLGKKLEINLSGNDLIAESNLEKRAYLDIIDDVYESLKNDEKVSELYRDFSSDEKNKIDIKDVYIKKYIHDIIKESSKKIDSNGELYIDKSSLENVRSSYITKFNELSKNTFINHVKKNKILNQDELRVLCRENNIISFKDEIGISEFEYLFNNNKEYLSLKLSEDDQIFTDDVVFKEYLFNVIDNDENLSLSSNWKDKICEQLIDENKHKLLNISENLEVIDGILFKDQDDFRGFMDENDIHDSVNTFGKNEDEIVYESKYKFVKEIIYEKQLDDNIETFKSIVVENNLELSEDEFRRVKNSYGEREFNVESYLAKIDPERRMFNLNNIDFSLVNDSIDIGTLIESRVIENITDDLKSTFEFNDEDIFKSIRLDNMDSYVDDYFYNIVIDKDYDKTLYEKAKNEFVSDIYDYASDEIDRYSKEKSILIKDLEKEKDKEEKLLSLREKKYTVEESIKQSERTSSEMKKQSLKNNIMNYMKKKNKKNFDDSIDKTIDNSIDLLFGQLKDIESNMKNLGDIEKVRRRITNMQDRMRDIDKYVSNLEKNINEIKDLNEGKSKELEKEKYKDINVKVKR